MRLSKRAQREIKLAGIQQGIWPDAARTVQPETRRSPVALPGIQRAAIAAAAAQAARAIRPEITRQVRAATQPARMALPGTQREARAIRPGITRRVRAVIRTAQMAVPVLWVLRAVLISRARTLTAYRTRILALLGQQNRVRRQQ